MGTGAKRRKRTHKNDKHIKKKYRTRRREKDLDQVRMYVHVALPIRTQNIITMLSSRVSEYCRNNIILDIDGPTTQQCQ